MDAIQFPILELIQLFICLLICIIISLLTCILLWSIYHHYMMLLEQSLPSSLLNCLPVSLLSRRGLGFLGYRYQIVLSTVGSLPGDCTSKNTLLSGHPHCHLAGPLWYLGTWLLSRQAREITMVPFHHCQTLALPPSQAPAMSLSRS